MPLGYLESSEVWVPLWLSVLTCQKEGVRVSPQNNSMLHWLANYQVSGCCSWRLVRWVISSPLPILPCSEDYAKLQGGVKHYVCSWVERWCQRHPFCLLLLPALQIQTVSDLISAAFQREDWQRPAFLSAPVRVMGTYGDTHLHLSNRGGLPPANWLFWFIQRVCRD